MGCLVSMDMSKLDKSSLGRGIKRLKTCNLLSFPGETAGISDGERSVEESGKMAKRLTLLKQSIF